MHLGHLYSAQPPVFSPCLPASLEVVDQAVVAAVQEKQHGVPDDASAARGALLEDVVALQPVRHRVCCHTKTKTSTRAALRSSKASMSSKFTGRSVGRPEKSTRASARAGCQPGAGQLGVGARAAHGP